MKQPLTVRFAPSPTGPLHVGGLRTAIFNYLFAKRVGGRFLLRIEDTDQKRFVSGAVEHIKESLDWVGIRPDEVMPSQASDSARYLTEAERLRREERAYYAFDTPKELEEMRHRQQSTGATQSHYNALSRQDMKNELTLSSSEVQHLLDNGAKPVLRFKVPLKDEILARDEIRDHIRVHSTTIEDKVLVKADGMPTYHLAHVVDDHLSSVTHVIRGEEWLPSLPLHLLIYEALGWKPPIFAHLPLILKPTGKGKLSKRDAEEGDFPIYPISWAGVRGFRAHGFLPEALLNFLACLGWSPKEGNELLSLSELSAQFSLSEVSKAGVRFDIAKARWYNQQYIRRCSAEELTYRLREQHTELANEYSEQQLVERAQLMQLRVGMLSEILSESRFLSEPPTYEEPLPQGITAQLPLLKAFAEEQCSQDTSIKEQYISLAKRHQVKLNQALPALRYALSAETQGPDLGEIIHLLGPSEVKKRVQHFLDSTSKSR